MKSVRKYMGGGGFQALASHFGSGALDSAFGAMGNHLGNYVANKIAPMPTAKRGMRVNKSGDKEPDYNANSYNTRQVDPTMRQIADMLTRDMSKMKDKRKSRVKKKAYLQGVEPDQFLRNRALARLAALGFGAAGAKGMGKRKLGI